MEPFNVIALAGQRNLKSMDSFSNTSTKQQKDMSLKLSWYIEDENRHKSVAKSRVLTPKQQDENGGNNLFSETVFNNCNFTLITADPGFSCDNGAAPPRPLQRRNSRESCPSLTAAVNIKQTFIILIFEKFIVYMCRRYFLDSETA